MAIPDRRSRKRDGGGELSEFDYHATRKNKRTPYACSDLQAASSGTIGAPASSRCSENLSRAAA